VFALEFGFDKENSGSSLLLLSMILKEMYLHGIFEETASYEDWEMVCMAVCHNYM